MSKTQKLDKREDGHDEPESAHGQERDHDGAL